MSKRESGKAKPWHAWPGKKPDAGLSVIVFRRDNGSMYLAWHCGRRWWAWNDDDGAEICLSFRPSHWSELPENPRNRSPEPHKKRPSAGNSSRLHRSTGSEAGER